MRIFEACSQRVAVDDPSSARLHTHCSTCTFCVKGESGNPAEEIYWFHQFRDFDRSGVQYLHSAEDLDRPSYCSLSHRCSRSQSSATVPDVPLQHGLKTVHRQQRAHLEAELESNPVCMNEGE